MTDIEVARNENYRTITVNGLFGGSRPGYIEAILYTDEMIADEALKEPVPDPAKIKILRTLKCRLIMDPIQAKLISDWFIKQISEYEKRFGKILTQEEMSQQKKEVSP